MVAEGNALGPRCPTFFCPGRAIRIVPCRSTVSFFRANRSRIESLNLRHLVWLSSKCWRPLAVPSPRGRRLRSGRALKTYVFSNPISRHASSLFTPLLHHSIPDNPAVSGKPQMIFMLCTAWPLAPLTRLSSALITISRPVRGSSRQAISMTFVPTTFFVSGRLFPSSRRMNGSRP